MHSVGVVRLLIIFFIALVVSGGAIALLRPLWRNYALAKPNSRSSHKIPTPQGGGIAVMLGVAATLPLIASSEELYGSFIAAVILGALGALDDLRNLPAIPRLWVQAIATVIAVALLPAGVHLIPALPLWFERSLLVISLLWFVNLTNFMDGIDWMTVTEFVPLTGAVALLGLQRGLGEDATLLAAALCGALIGFAPFNKPVAHLFLGDVGSLPLGLLTGWLLIRLAEYHFAAAILLPLYYLADGTITLLFRFVRREHLMQPHRLHFYQQAVDGELTVAGVLRLVLVTNVGLLVLAFVSVAVPSLAVSAGAVVAGCVVVGALLARFAYAKTR